MFLMYLSRQADAEFFYGTSSLIPESLSAEIIPEFTKQIFQWNFWRSEIATVVHWVYVLFLLLLTFGIGGKILCFFAWILHIGFLYRNYSVAFGADLISGIFLLYLSFTNSCSTWSILSFFPEALKKLGNRDPIAASSWNRFQNAQTVLSSVFYRMIQIQLCVIYAFTGFEKLKGVSWWDGTALWTVLSNSQLVLFDFSWLRWVPTVIALLSFFTIALEIYFPVLVWFEKTRKWILLAGFGFHFGIALALALPTFAAVMLCPYVLFFNENWVMKIKEILLYPFHFAFRPRNQY